MSINIVKGVEFGLGFEQTRRFGSQVHDVIDGRREDGTWIHRTNNAGGLTGGVTNGEPLVVRGAVKPISTLARPLPSADLVTGEAVDKAHYERSDICVVPAAGVVAEAMVMLTLARFVLEKIGGDSMAEVLDNLRRYQARIARTPAAPVPGDGSGGHGAGVGQRRTRRPTAPPTRPRTTEARPWTSCSSGCRDPARAPSADASRTATGRPSSTSTSGSRRPPAGASPRSSRRTARRPSGGSSARRWLRSARPTRSPGSGG